jgi:hypothetical protein
MFASRQAAAVPRLDGVGVRPQVVYVPVGAAGATQVASQPGPDAAGTQSAPRVRVIARYQIENAQASDLDRAAIGGSQDEDVRPRQSKA